MPVGCAIRRRSEYNFKAEVRDSSYSPFNWMDFIAIKKNIDIIHYQNNFKEVRIGPYYADGLCAQTNTIYEFNGCYYHKHDCEITKKLDSEWRKDQKEKFESTLKREQYLKDLGYNVESIWECEYRQLLKDDEDLKSFVDSRRPAFYRKYKNCKYGVSFQKNN